MNEYVRLDEVTKIIEEQIRKRNCLEMGGTDRTVLNVLQVVKTRIWKLDIVEAEPVRHGRWEWYEEEYTSYRPDPDYGWRCSCCKEDLEMMLIEGLPNTGIYVNLDDPERLPTIKRCPNCGCRMDGGAEDEHK